MVATYFPYSGQSQGNPGALEDSAIEQGGIEEKFFQRDITILAGDGNGSTYCIMQGIPAGSIITDLFGEIDAQAGFTSCSVGLYDSDTGVVIAIGCYVNALNVAAGSTKAAPFNLMGALSHAQTKQRVQDLALAAGVPAPGKGRYDLVMTAVAASAANITATVRGRIINSV